MIIIINEAPKITPSSYAKVARELEKTMMKMKKAKKASTDIILGMMKLNRELKKTLATGSPVPAT